MVYDRDRLQQGGGGGGGAKPDPAERAYVSICFPPNKRVQKPGDQGGGGGGEEGRRWDLDRWTSIPE